MKRLFLKFWPIIFIVFLWFVFANPYFLKNKVPYPSTYQVNHFHPWSLYQKFWGPVKNGAMPDVVDQIYPWKNFTIQTWKIGQVPLWNPYDFSGNPNLANFQTAVFSPFNLLFFVFPFADAMSIVILLQPILAGLFMYLYTRSVNFSKKASLLSSLSFMFCGFITVWMVYATLPYAILFLPLALYAIEKYWQSKKIIFLLILLLTIPLSFFSGHFQISLYFTFFVFGYIVFKYLLSKNLNLALGSFCAMFLGIAISLFQIFPAIELYKEAIRSSIFQAGEQIPLSYLPTLLAPDFFGNPVTRNDWFGHYAEWNGYIGVLPFMLAVYALSKIKKPQILFLFIFSILSLVLAFKTPFFDLIVTFRIPVISTSAASRIIVLFSFSFAVLAGFGFDFLSEDLRKNRKKILFWLTGFLSVIIFLWLIVILRLFLPIDKFAIAKSNLIFPTLLLFASSALILIGVFIKKKKISVFIPYILILIVAFDMFRFVQKWVPFDPKEFVFPNMAVIDAMKKNTGYGRVFGNLGAQVGSYYGIQTIEGYDPLYIQRYGEFIRSSGSGEYLEAERSVVKIARNAKYIERVLDLLAVNTIFNPIADTNQGWAYPVWVDKKRFSLVFDDGVTQLYKNKTAMEKAVLFYNFEVIKNDEEIIKKFYSDNFDFRNTLILEEEPKGIEKTNKSAPGEAKIQLYTPGKIIIKVFTPKPAFLFISDNYYSRWKAKVNGISSKIYRADYSFRAVVVPKGDSNVEFTYGGFF
ncbi:MAG: YfhO family protein [Candidatus Levybacteria bacterium]|nr:YfhO family protein [Candidatus Levybacteria bacterium]